MADLRDFLLTPEQAAEMDAPGTKDAAVLVPLYRDPLKTVLTERRPDLSRHAGEISFPGGREDDTDRDLIHTALREAHEEIGLDPDGVEVVGALQPTPTIATGYSVYPFVGIIEPGVEWTLSPREVDHVLELSVPDLRAGYGRQRLLRRGIPFRTDVYVVGDHLIWGATARILRDFLNHVTQVPEMMAALGLRN